MKTTCVLNPPFGLNERSSYCWMVFRTKNKTWTKVNNSNMISVCTVWLATFPNCLASCSTDSSTLHHFNLFGYFNGSKIFPLNNFLPWASLWLYNTLKMPPLFETINIADFILVLNRSLDNNKLLIYIGQWRDSTCQIFNQWNSVACLR